MNNNKLDIFVNGNEWTKAVIAKDNNGNLDVIPSPLTQTKNPEKPTENAGVGDWDNYFNSRS
jgi:hypothetical protein